ncbi:MAG: hypothetical protein LBT00_07040 [Spirochaetaceae bacterium]|jgi:hypothetical protein|nr:hypothetical protein [Spirochaetaceae bacterium]
MPINTKESGLEDLVQLEGKNSWFLPFNKGYKNGAGNPPNPKRLATARFCRNSTYMKQGRNEGAATCRWLSPHCILSFPCYLLYYPHHGKIPF